MIGYAASPPTQLAASTNVFNETVAVCSSCIESVDRMRAARPLRFAKARHVVREFLHAGRVRTDLVYGRNEFVYTLPVSVRGSAIDRMPREIRELRPTATRAIEGFVRSGDFTDVRKQPSVFVHDVWPKWIEFVRTRNEAMRVVRA